MVSPMMEFSKKASPIELFAEIKKQVKQPQPVNVPPSEREPRDSNAHANS
jgi:hypothetical protein